MSLENKINWRVIPADLRHPGIIMAMDSVLHKFVAEGKSDPTLVLHHWEPSISLAKPQSANDLDLNKCNDYGIKVVRTIGGGRAVLHNGFNDLSYSVFFPSNGVLDPSKYYDDFCGRLAKAVGSLGLPVEMKNEYDFHVKGKKIGGNAQHLTKDAVMQHGILLFDYSNYPIAEKMVDIMPGLYSKGDINKISDSLTWVKQHRKDLMLEDVYTSLINNMTGGNYNIGKLTHVENNAIKSEYNSLRDHTWFEGKSSRGWCWLPRGAPEGSLWRDNI